MRVIEPNHEAVAEYKAARERGQSCTFRQPYFEVEPFLRHFDGPPSLVTWDIDRNCRAVGWAIPYDILEARALVAPKRMGLGNPGLTWDLLYMGVSVVKIWVERMGGTMVPPDYSLKNIVEHPVETIMAIPKMAKIFMQRNIQFPHLKRVYIFSVCDLLTEIDRPLLQAFFGENVEIFNVFWRSWLGPVCTINIKDITRPGKVGELPLDGFRTKFDDDGHLFLQGPTLEGIHMLDREKATLFGPGAWVPTFNSAALINGELFVTGYVANPAQSGPPVGANIPPGNK